MFLGSQLASSIAVSLAFSAAGISPAGLGAILLPSGIMAVSACTYYSLGRLVDRLRRPLPPLGRFGNLRSLLLLQPLLAVLFALAVLLGPGLASGKESLGSAAARVADKLSLMAADMWTLCSSFPGGIFAIGLLPILVNELFVHGVFFTRLLRVAGVIPALVLTSFSFKTGELMPDTLFYGLTYLLTGSLMGTIAVRALYDGVWSYYESLCAPSSPTFSTREERMQRLELWAWISARWRSMQSSSAERVQEVVRRFSSAHSGLDEELRAAVHTVFAKADTAGKGYLTRDDFLTSVGFFDRHTEQQVVKALSSVLERSASDIAPSEPLPSHDSPACACAVRAIFRGSEVLTRDSVWMCSQYLADVGEAFFRESFPGGCTEEELYRFVRMSALADRMHAATRLKLLVEAKQGEAVPCAIFFYDKDGDRRYIAGFDLRDDGTPAQS